MRGLRRLTGRADVCGGGRSSSLSADTRSTGRCRGGARPPLPPRTPRRLASRSRPPASSRRSARVGKSLGVLAPPPGFHLTGAWRTSAPPAAARRARRRRRCRRVGRAKSPGARRRRNRSASRVARPGRRAGRSAAGAAVVAQKWREASSHPAKKRRAHSARSPRRPRGARSRNRRA
jgi:hypothetical protein